MDKSNHFSSALSLSERLIGGEISASELTNEFLKRNAAENDKLNAIVIDNKKEALETARKLDIAWKERSADGKLHGVPITIKESFNLKGLKTTVNFKKLKNNVATEDSIIATRLKDAGAIILGKTNVPTLLAGNQTFGPIYPTANNPYDLSRTPGGSSGGGAAAVAAGLSTFDVGTDVGGSIRNPASFCGIFGLKPTENQYLHSGHVPPFPNEDGGYVSMASIGPLARSMKDIELAWNVINQPDWKYLNSLPVKSNRAKHDDLANYKIGWFDDFEKVEASIPTKKVLNHFIKELTSNGVIVHKFKMDEQWLHQTYNVWATLYGFMTGQNASWTVRQFMKLKFRQQTQGASFNALQAFSNGLNMDFKVFSRALKMRQDIVAQLMIWFDDYDFIVSPVSVGPSFKHNPRQKSIKYEQRTISYPDYNYSYTLPYNACGNPSLIVPGGISEEGLPIGVQIASPHHSEPELIHFGKLVEDIGFKFQAPLNYL